MSCHIKDILVGLLHTQHDWQLQLLQNWSTIVGGLCTKIRLEKIENQTLVIGVYDSHWMHEIHMLSQPLMTRINNALEKPYIVKLRFKLVQPDHQRQKETVRKQVVNKHYELSWQEQKIITHFTDKEMQEALKKFLLRCKNYG